MGRESITFNEAMGKLGSISVSQPFHLGWAHKTLGGEHYTHKRNTLEQTPGAAQMYFLGGVLRPPNPKSRPLVAASRGTSLLEFGNYCFTVLYLEFICLLCET